ncbi:unnamed protein product [Discula destructiva]
MASSTKGNSNNTGKVNPPHRLAHVVLRSPNFKRSVAFYKAFLGGHANYENETVSFITYDTEHHRIALLNAPSCGPRNRQSAGLEHMAFGYDTLGDLLLAYRQRKSIGIEPIWCKNHGPTLSLYYQDPDGNQLETLVDVFETAEEGAAFMASEEFLENPIGVLVDPEELVTRFKGGEPVESILKRERIGPQTFDNLQVREAPARDVREVYPRVGEVEL